VIFRQVHPPVAWGLSDVTAIDDLDVKINPVGHLPASLG
jgi:hypothetical protein